MTTLRFDDNRGGLAYPFLPNELQWQIISRPFGDEDALEKIFQADPPTLRWVKDDKVLDLQIPDMNMTQFLERSGLQLSIHKGGYVLSKRLSRVMRPYRYWNFFDEDELTIDYNEFLDGNLWDGSGQVSRSFIQRLADSLDLDDRHRRELLHSNRFEVTTLHAGGQDKGHVLVVDDLAVDFMFPANSAKQELALVDGRIFIGLNPIHSKDEMCLDIQSLINLHPFFQPEHLLAWAGMESEMFLNGIKNGRLETILNRLYNAQSVSDLDSLAAWHVGEYIASGGSLMWFSGMVKAVAKQHLKRLGSRAGKFRMPVPGGRYYIFPAAVGHRDIPEGHIELDLTCATAWVNDNDWLTIIVDVLGGCDGDDAVWVMPFSDVSDSGKRKILIWRSPNQLGEYVVLQPTADSHTIEWATRENGRSVTYPKLDSRLLPNRIDSVRYQFGQLSVNSDQLAEANKQNSSTEYCPPNTEYCIEAMMPIIQRAAANLGTLGGFCNITMLCKAIYGRLPQKLPATLEDVIDGSVKTGLDLAPVQAWNQMALERMLKQGQTNPQRAMPQSLLARLPEWLRRQAVTADSHWLDTLTAAMVQHKAQYWADVEALATEACPPIELFENGRHWLHLGKELRQAYSRAVRKANRDGENDLLTEPFAIARSASETFLEQWPTDKQHNILIGAAAYLYTQGCSEQWGEPTRDGLLWQLGKRKPDDGREPGIAQMMLNALRQIGLLGDPVWTTEGAVLHYQNQPEARVAGVPIRLNGVWFNLLKATGKRPYARMGDVPPAERKQAKDRIANYVHEQFQGMLLTTEVTDNNRIITRTPQGNLFGYVQRDHELAAVRYDQWRIAFATAVDGNVHAVLQPA